MLKFGLKIGSKDTQYTEEIIRYYTDDIFQYIELFTIPETYQDTISYWKQFGIPFVIHGPHSAAGCNLADINSRKTNVHKIEDTIRFADDLKATHIIFHSGTNGRPEEVIHQLTTFADERVLIENKPICGLDGSVCVGCTYGDLKLIIDGIGKCCGFCLDFGHAICAANTRKKNPLMFIKELMQLNPKVFHLTDGDYGSELDAHFHYGEGNFPLRELLKFVPENGMVTNEAKRSSTENLFESKKDFDFLKEMG